MATVVMKRGDNSVMNATDNIDGLLFFNTDDKCMYLFNGTTKDVYGGKTQLLTSLGGEENGNAYSALAVKNNYVKLSTYNSAISGINSNISGINTQLSNVQGQLQVNSNTFYFDYQDGKWGFNTSSNRGADTFHPFNSTNLTIEDIEISATIAALKIKESTTTSDTNISINFMRGSAERTYFSSYYGLAYQGDIVHIFDDYNGLTGSSNGSHEHYVFDTSWHKATDSPSPLKTLESTAYIGFPFVINRLVDYTYAGNNIKLRVDDLYFYVCNKTGSTSYIKIYKYNIPDNPTHTYSGTWEVVNRATHNLSTSSSVSNYIVGSKGGRVVFNNQLYLFGCHHQSSSAVVNDNLIYIWNPSTQLWTTKSLPTNIRNRTIYGAVAHNKKIYLMLDNNKIAIYDGDATCTIVTPTIDSNLTYDSMTSFVEYNSQIHWLGGSAHPKIHVILEEYKDVDNNDVYYAYKTTDLKYNFKEGCALTTYPAQALSMLTVADESNIAAQQTKVIRCLGTSQANTDTYSYRKYNRILQDTYVGNICNADDCLVSSTF